MTFSPDTLNFNFFIYEFTNEAEYNSLRLVQQRSYAIASEAITTDEISALLSHVHLVPEPQSIPFPQADRFDRVVELLSLLAKRETGELTRDDITENYQFDARQTNYYTDAARYIGLIDKFINKTTREITFRLTNEAQKLLHKDHKRKHLGLIRKILEHVVYYKAFQLTLQQGRIPTKEEISQIIKNSRPDIGGTTPERRASTVRGWIEWIWKQIDD